jgi:hypothetical protein
MLTANRRFAIVYVCLCLYSDWNGWGVRIPAPSEGREEGATECTQAWAGGGVALEECVRQRAIGEVPTMAAEWVRLMSRG